MRPTIPAPGSGADLRRGLGGGGGGGGGGGNPVNITSHTYILVLVQSSPVSSATFVPCATNILRA